MTSISSILVGNFGWTAGFVAFYLLRTLLAQFKDGPITWRESKPIRLAASLALFVTGCVLFIVAAATAPTISVPGPSTYTVWSAWGILWLAELTALTAIGRVSPALCASALWTLYTLATRFSL